MGSAINLGGHVVNIEKYDIHSSADGVVGIMPN
jgi:hypothetical protein